jgi:phage terminase Nu1 subunit (DNA packaging protein)
MPRGGARTGAGRRTKTEFVQAAPQTDPPARDAPRKTGASKLVGSETVAELFHMTPRRVQQLAEEGVIFGEKIKNALKYDALAVCSEYILFLDKELKAKKDTEQKRLELERLAADTAYRKAKSEAATLELRELRGEYHKAEDVAAAFGAFAAAVRGALLAFPGRTAAKLAGGESRSAAAAILRAEASAVLNELAAFQYDAKAYERRARERRKMNDAE